MAIADTLQGQLDQALDIIFTLCTTEDDRIWQRAKLEGISLVGGLRTALGDCSRTDTKD